MSHSESMTLLTRQGRLGVIAIALAASILILVLPLQTSAQDQDATASHESQTRKAEAPDPKWDAQWDELPSPAPGAPNILLILTDDVGFGSSSAFGGPVPTPVLEQLAARGVKFTNFHTTAMCSPTRAALLTGRNHHSVGFGVIADYNAPYPGYNSALPDNARTVAEILRRSGYATSMFGKLHLTPSWSRALTGPHDQWPTKLGFDYFYGFLAADSDQWHPTLIRGTTLVDNGDKPAGLLDQDMVDDAIHWIHQARADDPDKPFFTYFSTGSAHAPHQAPKDWIARFRGRFDGGWDKLRAETIARQRESGILPDSAEVSPRPDVLPAWSELSETEQQLYARYMEVFAAQLAYQDAQFGRLFDELERMGELDKTLIIFIEGDNGASAEGGPEGTPSEMRGMFKDEARFSSAELADLDWLGSERSYQNYQAGWAWALNAPFPLFKQNASHLGGTRNGMVISWPKGITGPGRTIDRFQHVIDIGPTLLEAVGIAVPDMMDGVKQRPMQGTSLFGSLASAQPVKQSRTQYFELLGHRALYQDGWWASTIPPRPPWEGGNFDARDFVWQLFDLTEDPAQATDVSDRYPDRLEAMKTEWDRQALENEVYPLQAQPDWAKFRPRPKRDEFVFWGSDVHLPWTSQPDFQRGNFTIEATFNIDHMDQAVGVLMATGSLMGGWSLKLENGHPVLYNVATEAAADTFRIVGDIPVGIGEQLLIVKFLADSEKQAEGGTVTMTLNGRDIARQHVDRRAFRPLQTNEFFDIGMDTGVSVIAGEQTWQRFQGMISNVTVRQHQ